MDSKGGRPRMSWSDYFSQLAVLAAQRSEDPYLQVGAVAIRPDNSVAAMGYNGPPPGVNIDWNDRDARRPLIIHAEVNCLNRVQPGECDRIFSTFMPCPSCLAVIASKRIQRVGFIAEDHRGVESRIVAAKFGIKLFELTPLKQGDKL